jgi:hypothetical protein
MGMIDRKDAQVIGNGLLFLLVFALFVCGIAASLGLAFRVFDLVAG